MSGHCIDEGGAMEGSFLRFYVHENQRCDGHLAWEWLLMQSNKMEIRGGLAFRAMAGFGRHHHLHEDHFFELAGTMTVAVEFILTKEESWRRRQVLRQQKLRLCYARFPQLCGSLKSPRT